MTSLFNITQEKTTVIWVHYHEASTPFPTNQLELCNAQNCDDKLQPLIQYLKDGTLPKSALTAEKLCDKKASISSVTMTFYTANHLEGKEPLFDLVVSKTLQTQLLDRCHDHFTSGHLGLNKTYERLRST